MKQDINNQDLQNTSIKDETQTIQIEEPQTVFLSQSNPQGISYLLLNQKIQDLNAITLQRFKHALAKKIIKKINK